MIMFFTFAIGIAYAANGAFALHAIMTKTKSPLIHLRHPIEVAIGTSYLALGATMMFGLH